MTIRVHRTIRAILLRFALSAVLVESASAMPVEIVGRDNNGNLRLRSADLTVSAPPSVVSLSPSVRAGRIVVPVSPPPLPMGPDSVGPIFARGFVTASAGEVAGPVPVFPSGPSTPSLVSHALEVGEPPTPISAMGFGGVAIPFAQGTAPTVISVTIDGTVNPSLPQTPPVSNPLPGAVWLFATGLGLFPVLRRYCRKG
jgi:hypothetical protein